VVALIPVNGSKDDGDACRTAGSAESGTAELVQVLGNQLADPQSRLRSVSSLSARLTPKLRTAKMADGATVEWVDVADDFLPRTSPPATPPTASSLILTSPPAVAQPLPPPWSQTVVVVTLLAAGSVGDFGEEELIEISATIAAVAGVPPEAVSVVVVAGSVLITATVQVPATQDANDVQLALQRSMPTAQAARDLLGVQIEAQPLFTRRLAVPPSPPSEAGAPPLLPLAVQESSSRPSPLIIALPIVAAVIIAALSVLLIVSVTARKRVLQCFMGCCGADSKKAEYRPTASLVKSDKESDIVQVTLSNAQGARESMHPKPPAFNVASV